jgi:ubiquinone/menaquinone biosynthesis C-methylase UbiE
VRNSADSPVGDVGKHVPALSSALRPAPLTELAKWGGTRFVAKKRVLDLGCGDGRLALAVAAYASSVDGLDPDPEGIRAARKRARDLGLRNTRFTTGAAQSLPFEDAAFDVVISSWTL